jgi:dihydrofolate reductase
MTRLVLIAGVARDRAIGRGNALLWQLPADLKHFRRATMGHPVIMGRRTWDALPPKFRPLPGRRNVVVTRNRQWQADGAERAGSLDEALQRLADAPQAFVIGGGELYALALPRADELLLTEVDAAFPDADAFFPAWDRTQWREVAREPGAADAPWRHAFVTYRRVGSAGS